MRTVPLTTKGVSTAPPDPSPAMRLFPFFSAGGHHRYSPWFQTRTFPSLFFPATPLSFPSPPPANHTTPLLAILTPRSRSFFLLLRWQPRSPRFFFASRWIICADVRSLNCPRPARPPILSLRLDSRSSMNAFRAIMTKLSAGSFSFFPLSPPAASNPAPFPYTLSCSFRSCGMRHCFVFAFWAFRRKMTVRDRWFSSPSSRHCLLFSPFGDLPLVYRPPGACSVPGFSWCEWFH